MQRCDCPLVEVKADGDAMSFTGYGAVFGNVDSYGDVIAPGAFAETLRGAKTSGQWPAMLSQHGGFMGGADDMMPIGVWTDMAEDGRGLWVEGKLAPTQRGKDAYELLKMKPRPALNGLSIGFVAKEYSVGTKPKEPKRTLKNIDLIEVSLVTTPANPKARVQSVKSIDDVTELKEVEEILRDAGFSRKDACAIVSKVRRLSVQSDSAAAELEAIQASIARACAVFSPTP